MIGVSLAVIGAVAGGFLARDLYPKVRPSGSERYRPTAPEPSEEPPGTDTVRLSRAAKAHPEHDRVRALLQRHFRGINRGSYELWASTVVAEKRNNQPKGQWLSEYDTTFDGSILVYRILPDRDRGLRVLMTFTSVQQPEDAPNSMPVDCLRWRVVYRIRSTAGGLRLGEGLPDSSLFRPC